MEREVHALLGPLGVKEELSRLVCQDLRAIEDKSYDPSANAGLTDGVERAIRLPDENEDVKSGGWWRWRRTQVTEEDAGVKGDASDEMGLTAFLLKFGEGLGTSFRISPLRLKDWLTEQRKCPNRACTSRH